MDATSPVLTVPPSSHIPPLVLISGWPAVSGVVSTEGTELTEPELITFTPMPPLGVCNARRDNQNSQLKREQNISMEKRAYMIQLVADGL